MSFATGTVTKEFVLLIALGSSIYTSNIAFSTCHCHLQQVALEVRLNRKYAGLDDQWGNLWGTVISLPNKIKTQCVLYLELKYLVKLYAVLFFL